MDGTAPPAAAALSADSGALTDSPSRDPSARMVFISHKHQDADIQLATLVSNLLGRLSQRTVRFHQSSSVDERGPRFGEPISKELKDALAASRVVVLIYTDPTDQWDWCLWECGVATNPEDEAATRVEVFSFGGAIPKPYQSTLCVNVSAGCDRASLTKFLRQFCRDPNFWPDGQGAVAPNLLDDDIDEQVDWFFEQLEGCWPEGNPNRQAVLDAFNPLEADAQAQLVPAMQKAAKAVEWGTAPDAPHRDLFQACWNANYVDDLAKLADQTLVFRPPSVTPFWRKLVDLAVERAPSDEQGPWLRLVSGEGDAMRFWLTAMKRDSHAFAYEEVVRRGAQELHERFGRPMAERRFALPKRYFVDDPDRSSPFEEVMSWMQEANIEVSVTTREEVPERWRDFARIGDLAVSRFASDDGVSNRVLEESFSREQLERSDQVWGGELCPVWQSTSGTAFSEFLASRDGYL